jgi:hypothetical protein
MSSEFNYRGKLPFKITASCVNTGYNEEVIDSVEYNVEIVNQHLDEYGELQDAPAQGPFTEKWVGGNQHRHIPLNKGTDTQQTRPESFVISLSEETVRVYGPDINGLDKPRARMLRDNVSKAPVNLKNIKTKDGELGNFSHNYQVVQTSGRDINQSLIQNNLTASGVLTTKFIKFPEGNLTYNPPIPATAFVTSVPGVTFTAIPQGDDCGNSLSISFQIEPEMPGDSSITESGNHITVLSTGSVTLYQFIDFINNPSSWISTVPKCTAFSSEDDGIFFAFSSINFDGGTDGFTSGIEGDNHIYALPEEPNNDTVFVERFSAPGDWKESSRGALDRESEQYAPNNSLVTRNISVRQKLSSQLTQHMPQFGSGSTYALLPLTGTVNAVTEHKVNRNSILRIKQVNTTTVITPPTQATFTIGDVVFTSNLFGSLGNGLTVTLQMLSSGISVIGTDVTIGYPGDGGIVTDDLQDLVNNPANWPDSNQLFTVAASSTTELGEFGTGTFTGGTDGSSTSEVGFVTSSIFDNFNIQHAIPSTDLRYSWITESVVNSSFIQYQNPYDSQELIFNPSGFAVSGTNKQFAIDNNNINSLIKNSKIVNLTTNTHNVSSLIGLSASFSEIANSAYQYPVWKQVRTGEHPVARKLKEGNILSLEGDKTTFLNGTQSHTRRSNSVRNFREPPVTSKNKPLSNIFQIKDTDQKFNFTYTHTNNLSDFPTDLINDVLNFKINSQQMYDLLRKYYSNPNRETDDQNPFANLLKFNFSETLYPREVNAYLAETRGRTQYVLTQSGFTRDGYDRQLGTQRVFWRDNIEDRQRSQTTFRSSMSCSVTSRDGFFDEFGKFKFINSDSSTNIGEYETRQEFKNKIYLDSVHVVDNNLNNNETRFLSDTTVFISASASENAILTKQLDNGNSGELNGEIFLDYGYTDIKRPIAPIASTADFTPTKGHLAATTLSTPNFEVVVMEQEQIKNVSSADLKVITDISGNAGYGSFSVGDVFMHIDYNPQPGEVPVSIGRSGSFGSKLYLFNTSSAVTPFISGVIDSGRVALDISKLGIKNVVIATTASVDQYNSPLGNITDLEIFNLLNNPANWPDGKQYFIPTLTGIGPVQVIGIPEAPGLTIVGETAAGNYDPPKNIPSNVKLVEILPTLLDPPALNTQITIFYNSNTNAIYANDSDPSDLIIAITGSTALNAAQFISFVNDASNWKTDPGGNLGLPFPPAIPTTPVEPVFFAVIDDPSLPLTASIFSNNSVYIDSGGTTATGVVNAQGTAIVNFTFIPVGNDSGNGWTVSLQSGPTSNITEVGENIIINVTSSIESSNITSNSLLSTDFVNFVNNPSSWLSGVPKFTATTPYNFVSVVEDDDVFAGGSDGIPATPRVRGQLVRVTEHSALTQFEPRTFVDLPGFLLDKVRTYASFSNMFNTPPLTFQPREFLNISCPRPKYLAFLGGFESGSRSYNITEGPGGEYNLDNYEFYTLQPSGTIKSTLDSGLKYSIEQMSGKKPWFDSYEKYSSDIRFVGQDYSIIPEFRISSHIPFYIKESGGNFLTKNKSIFELDGSDLVNWRSSLTSSQDRYEQNFTNGYLVTDSSSEAVEIQNENSSLSKIQKIKFKIHGIKKLLPYNGFYPQERTIQLANLFNEYMNDNVGGGFFRFTSNEDGTSGDILINSDIPSDQSNIIDIFGNNSQLYSNFSKNTVMPHFFAPGILYNTIKSGISVDFPAITASAEQLFNVKDSQNKQDSMSIFEEIPFSLTPDGPAEFTGSVIASGFLNARFPFESLIFPNLAIPYSDKVPPNTEITGVTKAQVEQEFRETLEGVLFNIKMDPNAHPDKFYIDEFAIGRGWKRTVPFAYLKNDKIENPSYSMAMSNFLAEIPRFFLEEGQMNVFRSAEVKNWKNFDKNKTYYLDLKMRKSKDLVMIESYNSPAHVTGTSIEKTMNGRYFGWPVNKTTGTLLQKMPGGVLEEEMCLMHNDPAYAPFTPPYFEGEAILRLEMKPTKEVYTSVKEIFNDVTASDIFSSIAKVIDTGSDAYKYKMSIQDCLAVFGVGKNKEVSFDTFGGASTVADTLDASREYWAISPKLETPVLDFSEQVLTPHTGAYWVSSGYGRGMWSGYGKIPTGSQGIILELAESFPLQKELRYGRINSKNTGSLLDQIGFKAETKKIGQIAQKKTISEAIVAIPFVDRPIDGVTTYIDGHHFFAINPFIFDSQKRQIELNKLENGETSITRMIRLMKQYVIPPNFDFLTYYRNPNIQGIRDRREGIEPFVMYLFEFIHDLDQQDLSDIWQGVMPKIAVKAEKEEINFTHNLGENELFGEDFRIPNNMRWMIFKVKKKAEWNYFAVTENISDDDRFQFNFANSEIAKTPEYSYNWPYDYFSLVELAKVDVSYEFRELTSEEKTEMIKTTVNQYDLRGGINAASSITQVNEFNLSQFKHPTKK